MSRRLRFDHVLELLRDPRLDHLLGRDLDPRPGRRVAARTLLTLLHHQLRDPREHELSAPQQLLLGQLLQFVEELAGLRTPDAEALGEMV